MHDNRTVQDVHVVSEITETIAVVVPEGVGLEMDMAIFRDVMLVAGVVEKPDGSQLAPSTDMADAMECVMFLAGDNVPSYLQFPFIECIHIQWLDAHGESQRRPQPTDCQSALAWLFALPDQQGSAVMCRAALWAVRIASDPRFVDHLELERALLLQRGN